MQTVMFFALAAVTLGSALGVVLSRNLFRSALWLVLAFFGIAGIFILLHAEFLAVAQVLIYVGAISILIIFAIMLSRGVMDPKAPRFNQQWGITGGFAALLMAVLSVVLLRTEWPVDPAVVPPNTLERLGEAFVGPYVVPFEIASILLVVAMIGAIIIAREKE
jgi:NADH-quinone oxidoreductase subunit J